VVSGAYLSVEVFAPLEDILIWARLLVITELTPKELET
jgi:hypothetical protein